MEIDQSASDKEIKAQYRKLAKIWYYFLLINFSRHPDKNKNCGKSCEEKFIKLKTAYDTLSNEQSRQTYD